MLTVGNEIKLGYTAKVNEKMFSSIIPFKTVEVLDRKICFESSYFLREYIHNSFQKIFDEQAKQLVDILQESTEYINQIKFIDVIDSCGKILKSIWKKSFSALQNSLPLDRQTKDELYHAVSSKINESHFYAVNAEMKDLAILFEDINEDVDNAKIQGELNRMCRGKWSGGGFGLGDAVKGAVTATALNAGTGLLYGVANSISLSNAKNKAEKMKLEAFQASLNFLNRVLTRIPEDTESSTYWFLYEKYILSYSQSPEKCENVYELYHKESNEQKKIELAINLIKLNPYAVKYYTPLMEQIFNEDLDKVKTDIVEFCKICEWFKVDMTQEKQNFETAKKQEILQNHQKDDIKCCELIFKLETVLGYQTDIHNTVLKKYLSSNRKFQFQKYSVEELYTIADALKDFKTKFSYPAENQLFLSLKEYIQYHLENDFPTSQEALKNLLDDIDTFCRKYHEVKQHAPELRKCILDEYIKRSSELNICDFTFHELHLTTEAINNFAVTFSYPPEGLITERINQYVKYHINNELNTYTPEEINVCCKNIDLLHSEFSQFNDVLRAAKQQVIQKIFSYYNIEINSHDNQKIKYNIEKLTSLNASCSWDFSSFIQNETALLKKIQAEKDINNRTVDGILYDTVDAADTARKEMDIIKKITGDTAELSMANRFVKIMQYDFKTEQAKSEIKNQEKKLIEHINHLRNLSHHKSSVFRFFLSSLATPIIACVGIAFHLIGIIIALCVIVAIWNSYYESFQECREHNKEATESKAEIKEFESLFIVKNNQLIKRK